MHDVQSAVACVLGLCLTCINQFVRCRRIGLLGDAACVFGLHHMCMSFLSHTCRRIGLLGAAADALSLSVGTSLVRACTHEALGQLETLLRLRRALSICTSDRLNAQK